MAGSIVISTSRNSEDIRTWLDSSFTALCKAGINVDMKERALGDYVVLDCSIEKNNGSNQEVLVKHYIAKVVSDFIVGRWEKIILSNMTKHQYYYLTDEEKGYVLTKAREMLEGVSAPTGLNSWLLYKPNRKNEILERIFEYLNSHDDLNIDGFINFRLRDYLDDLKKVLEQAADEFMMEKEYQEFIRLLKYFVDIQEPRVEKVHVRLTSNGTFQLYDGGTNTAINQNYLDGFQIEMKENEINYDDLLISALITLAPREVILHIRDTVKVKTVVSTVTGVFGDRAVICGGCQFCSYSQKH